MPRLKKRPMTKRRCTGRAAAALKWCPALKRCKCKDGKFLVPTDYGVYTGGAIYIVPCRQAPDGDRFAKAVWVQSEKTEFAICIDNPKQLAALLVILINDPSEQP